MGVALRGLDCSSESGGNILIGFLEEFGKETNKCDLEFVLMLYLAKQTKLSSNIKDEGSSK